MAEQFTKMELSAQLKDVLKELDKVTDAIILTYLFDNEEIEK